MKKHLLVVGFLFLVGCNTVTKQEKREDDLNSSELSIDGIEADAQKVVKFLLEEQYIKATSSFDDKLRLDFPPHTLEAKWKKELETLGSFKFIHGSYVDRIRGYNVVNIPVQFSEGRLLVQAFYGTHEKISNFFFFKK